MKNFLNPELIYFVSRNRISQVAIVKQIKQLHSEGKIPNNAVISTQTLSRLLNGKSTFSDQVEGAIIKATKALLGQRQFKELWKISQVEFYRKSTIVRSVNDAVQFYENEQVDLDDAAQAESEFHSALIDEFSNDAVDFFRILKKQSQDYLLDNLFILERIPIDAFHLLVEAREKNRKKLLRKFLNDINLEYEFFGFPYDVNYGLREDNFFFLERLLRLSYCPNQLFINESEELDKYFDAWNGGEKKEKSLIKNFTPQEKRFADWFANEIYNDDYIVTSEEGKRLFAKLLVFLDADRDEFALLHQAITFTYYFAYNFDGTKYPKNKSKNKQSCLSQEEEKKREAFATYRERLLNYKKRRD